MIIDRFVFQIKKGCYDAAVAVVKEEIAIAEKSSGSTHRLFTPFFGTFDQLVMESEFEDMARREAFWAKWATERVAVFGPKFDPLNTGVGSTEVWNVVDPAPHDPKCRLVNRRDFQVVPGGLDGVAGLLISTRGDAPTNIYVSNLGLMNRVAVEVEFENLSDYEAAWTAWLEEHTTPEFWAKWDSLTLPGGENLVWQLL